ncbi:MAG: cytochrome c biogenesis heme-transporting ATPase CcmA [Betaproteobacteria bacterium]|nr:MAG: cytochrome c biogenesis heme-transporting ATPase CcmA [Betaproteobacteria bacterium]
MLEAQGLDCERSGRTLFRGLTFSVAGGDLVRVAGPNGSGKTSLLRILCGLLAPTQGEVRWRGTPIRQLAEEYSRDLVYIGHASALKDDLTPYENLDFACCLAGVQVQREALCRALDALAVPALPVRKLSQGQRRRAALARLLLSQGVPLWLLDEPFAALDADAARYAEELIARHLQAGGSVLYTTHQHAALDSSARVIDLAVN